MLSPSLVQVSESISGSVVPLAMFILIAKVLPIWSLFWPVPQNISLTWHREPNLPRTVCSRVNPPPPPHKIAHLRIAAAPALPPIKQRLLPPPFSILPSSNAGRQVTVEDDMMCSAENSFSPVQQSGAMQWREELVVRSVIARNLNWPKEDSSSCWRF